jgi:hypothetical protein
MANVVSTLFATKLFGRQINLTIGFPNDPSLNTSVAFNEKNATGRDISGQDIEFVVEKDLKSTVPNTCQIKVWNLSETTRKAFTNGQKLTVRLEAGYVGGASQIYFGEARAAWTTLENQCDYVTHIESTDTVAHPTSVTKTKKNTSNIYRTMGAKVPLKDAMAQIAQALDVDEGNLQTALLRAPGASSIQTVSGGAVVGAAFQRLTDLCRSAGLEWSVQDGALQFLNIGQALSDTKALLLSDNPNTGIIGSPLVDSQDYVTVETLLLPGLLPGVKVKLDTLFVSGTYRVEKARYSGSTFALPWYCNFDASPLG